VNAMRHTTAPRVQACLSHFRAAHAAGQPPLVLVLDVDETLWRSYVPNVHKPSKPMAVEPDFTVQLKSDGEVPTSATDMGDEGRMAHAFQENDIRVALRPGLAKFFKWIRERRSDGLIEGPWIFTQGSQIYLNALMPMVDPTGDIFGDRILTRAACTRLRTPWPWVHKELDRVPCGEDKGVHPERVILVENNPMSGLLYPDHLLMVHDWTGQNAFDRELKRVSATIDAVLADAKGAPGDYAAKLRDATPGHDDFKQALEHLHGLVKLDQPPKKKPAQAIKEVWYKAVRAKTQLIEQQPRLSSPASISAPGLGA